MRIMSILHALLIGASEPSRSEFELSMRGAPPVIDELPYRREIPSRRYYGAPESYPNGPGWTCAHVKRMAAKKRNRARHKAAVRRRRGNYQGNVMKRAYLLLKALLLEIELDGGDRSVLGRLAQARADYCATFPPGVRFTWRAA